ncbi:MAG: PorT family protein [Chitinophagaceae bacterium]|nr:MAG: PorT family protein [Chitinophagaceae bacterium]
MFWRRTGICAGLSTGEFCGIKSKVTTMKKMMATALAAAALTATNAQAQKGLSLEVKGIPQFSFLQNSDDNNKSGIDRKATFDGAFGVGATYGISSKAGIGLDVLYSIQGQKYEVANGTNFWKLSYVKIPLYFTYTASPARAVSFTAKVGPQLSLLTGASITNGEGHDLVADMKERYEGVTFGAVAGAGARFRLSSNLSLNTQVRFDYDFTNAEDESYAQYPAGRAKTYNSTAGLEVGLAYRLK